MEDAQLTAGLRSDLAQRIGQQRYDLWFGPPTEFAFVGGELTVRVASAFLRDWISKHFRCDLEASFVAATGRDTTVGFEVDASLLLNASASPNSPASPRPSASKPQRPAVNEKPADVAGVSPPTQHCQFGSERLTFEDLVVGGSNEFAVNTARMIAGGHHQISPVLFWGPTGVGKSHLLRAIRTDFRKSAPRARAIFMTAEQFTTGFVDAVRGSGLPSFRQKCRGADLLVLDDIHFLIGKRATLEELLHTIDSIAADGRKLVLASDRSLAELQTIGAELVSRLSCGIACEVKLPTYSERLAILQQLCTRMRLNLGEEILSSVAGSVTAGARQLQGALNRLQLINATQREPLSPQSAIDALSDLAQQNARSVRLIDIQKAVCDVFGIEPGGLRSNRKARSLSEPRMLAMWLARKYTRAPWSEIGHFFGRRSHSTVISAHRRVEKLMSRQESIGISDYSCTVEDAIRRVETILRTA